MFTVTVFSLLVGARLTDVWTHGWSAEVPVTVALFAVPMLYALPASRRIAQRYKWALLAAQGTATLVSFAAFAKHWQVGIDGLLAGLVLLTVEGRLGWFIAGLLLAAELAVRAAVTGMPLALSWWVNAALVVSYYVDDALIVFGMVRLSEIVAEVQDARGHAAQLAVASERLQATASLQAAVGDHLASIASNVAGAQASMPHGEAEARARVEAAGAEAREGASQARAIPTSPTPRLRPALPTAGRAVIGSRLAFAIVVTVLAMFSLADGSLVFILPIGAGRVAVVIGGMVLTGVLQLYHSHAVAQDRRPRAWRMTLALQTLLVYSFVFPFVWAYNGSLAPFAAASILLLVPGPWRWVGYSALVISYSVLSVALPLVGNNIVNGVGPQVPVALNYAIEIAEVGLLVYGLSRLATLARQLEILQDRVAETAAVNERLRVARDVHDLLGLGLSAIALKADLISKLIGLDNARANAEIQEVGRICAAATADLRLITEDGARLSLPTELDAARRILTSAGVHVRAVAPSGPLSGDADHVLAAVLREAVTNVLRHSKATGCLVEIATTAETAKLKVSNDGVVPPVKPAPATGERVGHGLANLAARIGSASGELDCHQVGGSFTVIAQVPLTPGPPPPEQAVHGRRRRSAGVSDRLADRHIPVTSEEGLA